MNTEIVSVSSKNSNTYIKKYFINGGPAEGFNLNAASNWPLRGVKNTLWEGGVRGAALIFSPSLSNVNRVSNQTMHISDWLPTLYHAAGGNIEYVQYTHNIYFILYLSLCLQFQVKNFFFLQGI